MQDVTIGVTDASEEALRAEVTAIVQAEPRYLEILDDETQQVAVRRLLRVKGLMKKVGSLYDEACSKAFELHRLLTGKRGELLKPLQAAHDGITRSVKEYEFRVREAQLAEQRAIEAKAREEAEKAKAAQVQALKAAGEAEAAKAVAAAPVQVYVPPEPVRAPVQGVPMTKHWKFEITDPAAVPREWCCPDEKRIGAYVRSLKADPKIPGVRAWAE